jgi:hypothetical protein
MLGDEMGLDESVEALAVMFCHLHAEGQRHFLVVCVRPASWSTGLTRSGSTAS